MFNSKIFQQMLINRAVDFKIEFPNRQRRTYTRGIFVYILLINVPF